MVLTMDVLANNYSNQGHDDNGTIEVHKTRCIPFYMRSEFILSLSPFGLFQQECDCVVGLYIYCHVEIICSAYFVLSKLSYILDVVMYHM